MAPLEALPSLLVFGPQAEFPPSEALQQLRHELITNPLLSALRHAVARLPQLWEKVVDFDPSLAQVHGAKSLAQLSLWVTEGGSFPRPEGDSVNHFALPATVLFQISQYARYLSHLGNCSDVHRELVGSVNAGGGVQGFCVGFLSAVAVAGSQTEADLGSAAATALRLAVCVGAYVDKESDSHATVAIRWRQGNADDKAEVDKVLESYSGAYISSVNDDSCVTVTVRAADLDDLIAKIKHQGLHARPVHVRGRFHTAGHSEAVEKLTKLVSRSEELQFSGVARLQAPVRSTVDGEIISEGSLTRLALENTLLRRADWYATLKSSILQMSESNKRVAFAGFGNQIPSSLVQTSSLRVLALNSLQVANPEPSSSSPSLPEYPSHSIAIVGMAGRFPGADSVDELWDLITQGKVMVERAPVDRFNLPQTGDHKNTKWWGNFLRDPEAFDHRFFKKSSREAVAWDPQQRILLEVVYEALESSGYFGASSSSAVEPDDYGCYIGAVMNNYYDNMSCHPATAYATIGTSRCFISGCMSHYFGWTGPSLTIDTACSSSLVAINTACRAIWSGECSRAIAGGTNVICSPFDYQNLSAAGLLSPSGQCKPFDADADGYCRGEAVAVVVLKRLEDAIKENYNILGVIIGSAANQNYNHSHITVPHSGSQVKIYQQVTQMGGVTPEAVSYVEAHGTGTGVGDPVEVRSIRDAFGGAHRESLLHFSSIKGNIGHTEATAGVAGLIKVLLMMRHGQIAAQASHNKLSPKLPPFGQAQMAIPKSLIPWNPPFRLACVNSSGAAGSNSAVMVREKPPRTSIRPESAPLLSQYPLFISAGSANSLSMYSTKLLSWLRESRKTTTADDILSSLTFNLADRANRALSHTLSTTVRSVQDLESKLEAAASGSGIITNVLPLNPKPVVLVFGGQESDFIGLSEGVYKSSKVFRQHLDSVNDLVVSQGLGSLYPSIFSSEPLENLVTLHAALFAVQYASAKAWIDSGLKVSAVVGHSFGQLTAFAVSGALSLADALKLVTGRAALIATHWGAEPGSMLFLQADRQAVDDTLKSLKAENTHETGDLYAEIACYNGPKSHVVVGSSKTINLLERGIASTRSLVHVRTKKLKVTNGFHSKYTEGLLPHLTELARTLEWKRPAIHLETTDEFESKTEPDSSIVAEHTRRPVFFQRAVERLTRRFARATWIEAGRGSSVIRLVQGSVPDSSQGVHAFLSPQLTTANSMASLVDTTVNLWKSGYSVQYWPFHRSQKAEYEYLSLPPYQFEKTRHWLPFTGRGVMDKDAATAAVKEVEEETHELLRFVEFKDAGKSEAVFKIDPKSDRFQAMVGGHVMAGQTLAPASLYFEVIARAALLLQDDTAAATYVPVVANLVMKSPIGQDTSKRIVLTLKKLNGAVHPSWDFSITTQETVGRAIAAPFEQCNGRVSLKRRDDAQAALDFDRFERLTGNRRIESILNHPDAERMQGSHIYRALNTFVHYGPNFRGIKQVACVGNEAAGRVVMTPDINDPADQRLTHAPMTDSFMQFAGFLVNYFNNPSMDDVLVCMKIEHLEIGGRFDPDAGEWLIYSNMTEGGETDASSDVYVFDTRTNKMVMAAFGCRVSKMPQALLARMLKRVNKLVTIAVDGKAAAPTTKKTKETKEPKKKAAADATASNSKRGELFRVLSDVTEIPVDELKDDSTLRDLGVDSLMATEVLNDIRSVLGLTIDLSTFLFFPDLKALATHVDEKLGVVAGTTDGADGDDDDDEDATPPSPDSGIADMGTPFTKGKPVGSTTPEPMPAVEDRRPTIRSAIDDFQETRFNYDQLAKGTGALGFWSDAYPPQARLVLAYVVEAFAQLGCDLSTLQPGAAVSEAHGTLPRHKQLVRQLYRVLEDGKLIAGQPGSFKRTATPVDKTPASTIYDEILPLHPHHAVVNKLVKAVGSQLAPCLVGDLDGLQVVFGDRETKKTLEEMYEFWPLLRTPTLVLGDFLIKAFTDSTSSTGGSGAFRILEIGGGSGATTRYIVNHLRSHGIKFEYVFTDISASLVAAAKKQFRGVDEGMSFEVLDVEKVPDKYKGAFHSVISTNCIHATRDLASSLKNIRGMLRDDGALTLIEVTRNQFWLDVVVGLFEGWWLFEDGREHALVDERHWEGEMRGAGFSEVLWSDGESEESKTVRVIAAFPTGKAAAAGASVQQPQQQQQAKKGAKAVSETVVYKKIGDQEIHADVYYPAEGEPLPNKKLPVALMIHGGSHIIFSRKDIRPAQTRLLIEQGYVPVSLDHRLCPEVRLVEGPMVDVCDALDWARNTLPSITLRRPDLRIDGERVVVVGWSSGGQLAMSLAWTAPQRGLRPPEAILAFYCPTDYQDPWWQNPIQPIGAVDRGLEYDVLEAIQDEPITNYGMVGAWEPLSDPRILTDPRSRIVLHINWKAQTLPVIINGLKSRRKANAEDSAKDWNKLPQPSLDEITRVSPRAQIAAGNYKTPTFLVHGTADDLIPWEQSQGTYETLLEKGVVSGLALVRDGPHICDLSSDVASDGWKAVVRGYEFLARYV
ncbi:hypothetical protein QBC42DRAFT_174989 [Cladorrhinum samala]|uniref:S-adenosyl-L-methionine-dependent N-methyltransferase n=1 Tax=Cladorrhinum samala TaxID=585594 RepID=A0AAV9HTM1_9PEZI|nr:hypothetical protein QBC42DRAFT_174989 [Cladorrhinum samala]